MSDFEGTPDPEQGLSRRELDDIIAEQDLDVQAQYFLGPPDEEEMDSSEDELSQIHESLKTRLGILGVTGLSGIDKDSNLRLWEEMDCKESLTDDLVFYTISQKQRFLKDPFTRPSFNDLSQVANSFVNPYSIRSNLVEEVVPNLVNLGIKERNAYRWAQVGSERRSESARFLGWLAGQRFMSDFPQIVHSEFRSHNGSIKANKLLVLATEEVERQLRIHQAGPRNGFYNLDIGFELEAYKQGERVLSDSLNACDLIFFGNAGK